MTEDDLVDALEEALDNLADLRARVEAVVASWPPGVRKGDVLRAIGLSDE